MTRTAKLTVAALTVAVLVLGAVLLGGVGKKNQRVLRAQAIEKQLPGEVTTWIAQNDATGRASKATCVNRTARDMRCVVSIVDGDEISEVPVSVTVDADRGTFIWQADQ